MASSTPTAEVIKDEVRNKRNRPIFLRDIFIIRLINAWWLATFFQPDEYFQALEPAWNLAFGDKSGAWLTWEWQYQLRSSLHPAIFSAAYIIGDKVSSLLPQSNLLRAKVLIAAPRALQAFFAALGDWYTWQLAVKTYGANSNVSFFALFLQLFSPWQWYCSTRTFSNSVEMTLTVMALYYFPWAILNTTTPAKENLKPRVPYFSIWSLRASLALAAFAVILRPTNVLIWATIFFIVLTRATLKGTGPLPVSVLLILLREGIICGSLVLATSLASDRLYFGFWTFPPYKWLFFNISQSLAVFYGRNPWHYYLLQGLPLICTTSLPFALKALYKTSATSNEQTNILKTLSYTVFTTITALSLISHKEVRFIYPLLPILNVLAAPATAKFFTTPPTAKSRRPTIRNKPYLILGLGINLLLAGFLTFIHQPAPLTVLNYLRGEYERIHPSTLTLEPPVQDQELFALFLMPCHTTPWRSHLVYPGLRAYALTCEPPLHTKPNTPERENYRDEADRFYDAPVEFLSKELFTEGNVPVPRYIVGFQGIEPWLEEYLQTTHGETTGMKLRRVWGRFNGFFHEDWRRSGKMLVWDTGVYENAPVKKAT